MRALSLEPGGEALVLEHFAGRPLAELLERRLAIEPYLRLALALADAVREVHEAGIVHRHLTPQAFLVDEHMAVRLHDLDLATSVQRERQATFPPFITGSLPYLAPEQTGRTPWVVDMRSDLYALGLIFYALWSGRHPLRASDPPSWIHAHLVQQPPPLEEQRRDTPPLLGAIVARLVAKAPDDRYQTASGLCRDLRRLLELGPASFDEARFALGERDVPSRLAISQRLRGRADDLARLSDVFASVAHAGRPALARIFGPAGIGKSSLVGELVPIVAAANGSVLIGHFDRGSRDAPYGVLAQALAGLVPEIMTEPEDRRERWHARLGAALEQNGALVVDLIPDLAVVVGPQPPIAALPLTDSRDRFRRTWRRFLAAVAEPGHPVVIVLEDAHFGDDETLTLLETLLMHADTSHLMVVLTYRDGAVAHDHPLVLACERMQAGGVAIHDVRLGPLSLADLRALLADCLHARADDVAPLASVVLDTTGGNPLFVAQFVSSLADRDLLWLDVDRGTWRWDLDAIQAQPVTDNVVDLLIGKLGRLSPACRTLLEHMALLGVDVDAAELALVTGSAIDALHDGLLEAVHAGMLVRTGARYRFAHDRVRQAAETLAPDPLRAARHRAIAGTRLLAHTPPERSTIGPSRSSITTSTHRPILEPAGHRRSRSYRLRAGRRATMTASHATAVDHLLEGVRLVGEQTGKQ